MHDSRNEAWRHLCDNFHTASKTFPFLHCLAVAGRLSEFPWQDVLNRPGGHAQQHLLWDGQAVIESQVWSVAFFDGRGVINSHAIDETRAAIKRHEQLAKQAITLFDAIIPGFVRTLEPSGQWLTILFMLSPVGTFIRGVARTPYCHTRRENPVFRVGFDLIQLMPKHLADFNRDQRHSDLGLDPNCQGWHLSELDPRKERLAEIALLHGEEMASWGLMAVPVEIEKNILGKEGTAEKTPSDNRKPKRSTQRGEAQIKLIAALTKHHKYADGGCLNLAPIGNNELARLAEVSESTASTFFNNQFTGHTKYRAICADAPHLVAALKLLNQEFAPHHLFGAKPPGEDEREDSE